MTSDTGDRILNSAEQLFAGRGLATVTLRDITAAAEVNLAAVNYHFGSRGGLIEAVLRRRLEPLNRGRLDNLHHLEKGAAGKPLPLEDIIYAFISPLIRISQDPTHGGAVAMRLLGRASLDTTPRFREFFDAEHKPVLDRYHAAFVKAAPYLSADQVYWRLRSMIGALIFPIPELYATPGSGRVRLQRYMQNLVPFITAGFRAPGGDFTTLTLRPMGSR